MRKRGAALMPLRLVVLFIVLLPSTRCHTRSGQRRQRREHRLRRGDPVTGETNRGSRRRQNSIATDDGIEISDPFSFLHSSSQGSRVDFQVDNNKRQRQQQEIRLLVTYKNEIGRRDIINVADRTFHDFVDEHLLAIQIHDQESYDHLMSDENITLVEIDHLWEQQGQLDGTVVTTQDQHHRSLVEKIPYGIHMVQADQVETGSYPVEVCIVDSGVAYDHPDIDTNRVNGIDRTSNMNKEVLHWNRDVRGHGSHVAGTIAAKGGNDIGIRGMGNVNVYVVRGLNDDGKAYESDIREAIEQCETRGSKIISLSLGGTKMSTAMDTLMTKLYSQDRIIVAAAGNHGSFLGNYPASHPAVINVAAVQEDRNYWPSSNFGPFIELSAPGHRVLSTSVDLTPTEELQYTYSEYSGTSMSTPHVAGAAAILWSHFPTCTNQQIRYALAYTADDVGPAGCDDDYGYGIVKVKDAFNFLIVNSCDEITATWGRTMGPKGACDTIDNEPPYRIEDTASLNGGATKSNGGGDNSIVGGGGGSIPDALFATTSTLTGPSYEPSISASPTATPSPTRTMIPTSTMNPTITMIPTKTTSPTVWSSTMIQTTMSPTTMSPTTMSPSAAPYLDEDEGASSSSSAIQAAIEKLKAKLPREWFLPP